MSRKIFLIHSPGVEQPGGVELEYRALSIFLAQMGLNFEYSSKDEVHNIVKSGDCVYIQEEGRLSPEYLQFAKRLLSKGVTIYEKNVFALPSDFRPVDPNYKMILMSFDGLYRYALRGSFKFNQQKTIFVVPNLPVLNYGKKETQIFQSFERENRPLKIMRAGRSDSTKWSRVEAQFCQDLCKVNPETKLELTLIGCPQELRQYSNSENLVIKHYDYSKNIDDFYARSDCYFLYSKIGETFGNTVFEAAYFNLRVVYVFDLTWDCAPVEYLNSYYPNSICVEISNLKNMDQSLFLSSYKKPTFSMSKMFLERNKEFFHSDFEKIAYLRPNVMSSIQYLISLARRYHVSFFRILAAIFKEILRERNFMEKYFKK